MRILVGLSAHTEELLDLAYPREFFAEDVLNEREFHMELPSGGLEFKEYWFEDVTIISAVNRSSGSLKLNMIAAEAHLVMHYWLEGESDISFCSSLDKLLEVKAMSSVFIVLLRKSFMRKLMASEIANPFERVESSSFLFASGGQFQIPVRILSLITEIRSAKQSGYIRRIFLEAKILELMAIQMEQLEKGSVISDQPLSEEDLVKLNNARKLVENSIQTPCSLIELSRKTGLNDFKLKKGFKTVFGNTVFGYLAELRMNTAYDLLQNGSSVNEVAETVGYKNPHHFSAAFKKRFNVLPSQLKVK